MMALDWMHLTMLAIGLVGGALAKHVMSGAKPVIDPNNQKPGVDMLRDMIRSEIVSIFGSSNPLLPKPSDSKSSDSKSSDPTVPAIPADHPLLDMLAQTLAMLKQQQKPADKPA